MEDHLVRRTHAATTQYQMNDNKHYAHITSYFCCRSEARGDVGRNGDPRGASGGAEETRARRSRCRRGAARKATAAVGSAGANDNEEAAPGREGNSKCRGERHDAAEATGQEAVTQVNVVDARSVLARS